MVYFVAWIGVAEEGGKKVGWKFAPPSSPSHSALAKEAMLKKV